jgi:hypothetical protein
MLRSLLQNKVYEESKQRETQNIKSLGKNFYSAHNAFN